MLLQPWQFLQRSFESEQLAFDIQTPGKTCQGAVAADNAMAGNDDGQRIAAVGGAHRPHRCRPVDGAGNIRVAAQSTPGYSRQRGPDRALEGGARRCQGQVELFALAGEVLS